MARCERCSAKVPAGRSYCHPHYIEAIRRYESDLVAYEEHMKAWSALSDKDKKQAHIQAEDEVMTFITVVTGLVAGAVFWWWLNHLYAIDGLYGLALMAAVCGFLVTVTPLKRLIGRFARTLAYAILHFVILSVLIGGLSLISDLVSEYKQWLFVVSAVLVIMVAASDELRGRHHASGGPVEPVEPMP